MIGALDCRRQTTGLRAAAGFLLVAAMLGPARADDASRWDGEARSAVRLIAGSPGSDHSSKFLRAGIEIRLAPGWKTYWRYPGDSGVPPRFDFARSDNIKSVDVSWPAPRGFSDGAGSSIGYKNDVIFPLRIVPKDEAKPVVLRLDLEYAICEKLCVPATSTVELAVGTATSAHDASLAASEARVPKPVTLGAPGPLAITSVRRTPEGPNGRIIVEVAAARNDAVELFAEGPTADWALPVPEPLGDASADTRRFVFAVDGLPPGATIDGAALRLTAVSDAAAIEVTTRLD
jgi:DsbC/DsbD-like thiol-disulfide interchange protein